MTTEITFRRGPNDPTSGSGLTLAEPAFNTTLHTFHIGLGYGVTAEWVGGPISGLSADIAAGITYKIPTLAAVKNYIGGLCYGNTGAATITQYVSSFNGLTGAVGGVCAEQTNTFTALQSFASGISASGITVGGSMTVTGNLMVSGGVTFTASETVLIEDNIIVLNSNVISSPSENAGIEIERGTSANVQLLWNENSDKWTFTNNGTIYYDMPTSVVTSFNGLTGAVGGACAAQANIFVPTQYFVGGLCSGFGITAESTVSSVGFSTISGYTGGYVSKTILSSDTISFVFDETDVQVLRPSDNLPGNNITNRLPSSSGTLALQSQLMGAVNGSTAATSAVTSFNGSTGAVQGVSAAVAGTGISVSGTTGAVTITNTGVQSVDGATGAVNNVARTNTANTFTQLQTFSNASGISAAQVQTKTIFTPTDALTLSGTVVSGSPSIKFPVSDLFDNVYYSTFKVNSLSADRTVSLPDASGTLALQSQLMGAVNGSTAATSAVTSFNGRTGAVQGVSAAVGGTGISVSGATGAVTITNTGVHTINGVTGAITNVAKTNVDNNFSDSQTISAPFGRLKVENTILGGTAEYLSSNINFYNGSNSQTFLPSLTNPTNTITFPDFTTTLVGLAGTQTFTGTKTFNTLTNFNAGISAAGATFSGDIVVNGGDITTTASTATLYNTNAATVAIGGSAGSITISSGNTAGLTFGVGSYHKFKTNRVETVTTSQTEIFRFNYKNASFSSVGGLDAAYAEIIITAERTTGFGACSGTQITKLLIASNPADGTVFHTEYGNVNTNGNLASYTASVSGNDVIVYATPTSLDETVFKVLATLIRGEFGEGI